MTRPGRRRRWGALVVVALVTVATGAATIAWVRRTAPPWPAVAGTPYEIPLGPDGCPVTEEWPRFVDAPGRFVPPGATTVLLCTTPTALHTPRPGVADPPRQRLLRAGASDFAALLNRLPDRNEAWRRWQRRHSGWWPDAAPAPLGEACPAIGYSHTQSFVLRYPDRPPIPLIYTCGQGGGLTSGTRTRMDDAKPHLVDEFLSRYQEQECPD